MVKTCCITGHRDIPKNKLDYVYTNLEEKIQQAIDDGFTRFISGFADGADLMFIEILAKKKQQLPGLSLEAAIPYANRINEGGQVLKDLLAQCDKIKIISKDFKIESFAIRNKYLVDNSQRVIAIYDGRTTGGTFFTIKYAIKMERDLRVIELKA